MLTGIDLGKALESAMLKKKVGPSAVAKHFDVAPSSVKDWQAYGRIHKKHIEELVAYFSDVVGPEHWGIRPGSPMAGTREHDGVHNGDRKMNDFEARLLATLREIPQEGRDKVMVLAVEIHEDVRTAVARRFNGGREGIKKQTTG